MSVASADLQASFAATLVDEWVRGGVTDAVVCPGSRSTPLAVALAERPELSVHVRLDERSAGFFALGLAAASGRPAVVCTTSGTAAAELHPSVVEAHHVGIPLIVCTADRPPELRQVGAPQTVDQEGLFAEAVRFACAPGVPDAASQPAWRSVGARLVVEATGGGRGPGPVHANLAFREPLLGTPSEVPAGRPGGRPWHRSAGRTRVDPSLVANLAGRARRRGLLVAGAGVEDPAAVVRLARRLGWPLLADPRSGCRLDAPGVVAAADAVLRDPALHQALAPEVVVRLGAPWSSKVLSQFVAASAVGGAEVVVVEPTGTWRDPERVADVSVAAPVADFVAALEDAVGSAPAGTPDSGAWASAWQRAEDAAQSALDDLLGPSTAPGDLDEAVVARHLLRLVPAGASLVVSSSMPVRDLEWYGPKLKAPPPVWSNRGANGIDGVASTALGWAAAGRGPTVALLGDLAFFHDVSAFIQPARATPGGSPVALVVVDNGGGGIFSFLPQAGALRAERFEQLFGTPMRQSVPAVARGLGAEVSEVGKVDELAACLAPLAGRVPGDPLVVHVAVSSRTENVARHDRLHEAVAAAVRGALA